jgi:hypothetical protein
MMFLVMHYKLPGTIEKSCSKLHKIVILFPGPIAIDTAAFSNHAIFKIGDRALGLYEYPGLYPTFLAKL